MRFYGREEELRKLSEIREQSLVSSTFTMVTGRRRIGKTSLMMRSVEGTRHLYLFVSKVSEPVLCSRMQDEAESAGIPIIGKITEFRDLFKALMIYSRTEPLTVIIDEFQDLHYVDRSIFGAIQEIWDTHYTDSHMNLIVGGSVHSLMVKLFEDSNEPLFGRATSKIVLRPFTVEMMRRILSDHDPDAGADDLLTLYMLTGGVPKYVGTLMDSGSTRKATMLDSALSTGSIFLRDGKDIMATDFGKNHSTYHSIMGLIASGKNQRSEIDSILGMDTGAYLKRLDEENQYIRQRSPMFSAKGSRNNRWEISDMYLRFYFRHIEPNSGYLESGRYDLLRRKVMSDIPTYEGKVLEALLIKMITEEWTYTDIGSYWNRKGDVEIDIIVLDRLDHHATVIEVKRNQSRFDERDLEWKVSTIAHELKGFDVTLRGMSREDIWTSVKHTSTEVSAENRSSHPKN